MPKINHCLNYVFVGLAWCCLLNCSNKPMSQASRDGEASTAVPLVNLPTATLPCDDLTAQGESACADAKIGCRWYKNRRDSTQGICRPAVHSFKECQDIPAGDPAACEALDYLPDGKICELSGAVCQEQVKGPEIPLPKISDCNALLTAATCATTVPENAAQGCFWDSNAVKTLFGYKLPFGKKGACFRKGVKCEDLSEDLCEISGSAHEQPCFVLRKFSHLHFIDKQRKYKQVCSPPVADCSDLEHPYDCDKSQGRILSGNKCDWIPRAKKCVVEK